MNEELFERIKQQSDGFRLEPPARVWNRIEYKLDRYAIRKRSKWRRKMHYAVSVVAVVIFTVMAILVLKQDKVTTVAHRCDLLIIDSGSDNTKQVYNVRDLNEFYNKLKTNKYSSAMKKIRVNRKHKS